MKEPEADYFGFIFFIILVIALNTLLTMKTICYISNFGKNLDSKTIDTLTKKVSLKNNKLGVTGLLIIKDNHFFQIIEGESHIIDELFDKISIDKRHNNLIKLLETQIEDRIFDDYNLGDYQIVKDYSNLKKLYLYFNWIKEAEYIPAIEIINLTTNFLKFSH